MTEQTSPTPASDAAAKPSLADEMAELLARHANATPSSDVPVAPAPAAQAAAPATGQPEQGNTPEDVPAAPAAEPAPQESETHLMDLADAELIARVNESDNPQMTPEEFQRLMTGLQPIVGETSE